MKIVFATNNEHKLSEIRAILGSQFEIVSLADIGCHEEIPETGTTLEENALMKAEYIYNKYHLSCFADDTGLEVEALNGAPGVFTARFGEMNGYGESHDANANIQCLLDKLKGQSNRRARFRTSIALILDGEEHLFEGVVEGIILEAKVGVGGFGYDPIFAPLEADGKAFAEMKAADKNKISHRGRAIEKLCCFLQSNRNNNNKL